MFVVSVWVIDMENRNKANLKKVLFVLLGIIFAILLSVPYIVCRKQIQQMMFVGYLSVVDACAISNSSMEYIPQRSNEIFEKYKRDWYCNGN